MKGILGISVTRLYLGAIALITNVWTAWTLCRSCGDGQQIRLMELGNSSVTVEINRCHANTTEICFDSSELGCWPASILDDMQLLQGENFNEPDALVFCSLAAKVFNMSAFAVNESGFCYGSNTFASFTSNTSCANATLAEPQTVYYLVNDSMEYTGPWGSWGSCNRACNNGTQYRSRTYVPSYRKDIESQPCNMISCPWVGKNHGSEVYKWFGCWADVVSMSDSESTSPILDTPASMRAAGVEKCAYTAYNAHEMFALCQYRCFVGNLTAVQYQLGGASASCPSGANAADVYIFDETLVKGEWTVWGGYDSCDLACGSGDQTRRRTCTNPSPYPSSGNSSLLCDDTYANETQNCNTDTCPTGFYSSYTAIGCYDISQSPMYSLATSFVASEPLLDQPQSLRKAALEKCALTAIKRGDFDFFGIKPDGECLIGNFSCLLSHPLTNSNPCPSSSYTLQVYSLSNAVTRETLYNPSICQQVAVWHTFNTISAELNSLSSLSAGQAVTMLHDLRTSISNSEMTVIALIRVVSILTEISDKLLVLLNSEGQTVVTAVGPLVNILMSSAVDGSLWLESETSPAFLLSIEEILLSSVSAMNSSSFYFDEYTGMSVSELDENATVLAVPPNVQVHVPQELLVNDSVYGAVVQYKSFANNLKRGFNLTSGEKEASSDKSWVIADIVVSVRVNSYRSGSVLNQSIVLRIPLDGIDSTQELICIYWDVGLGKWSDSGCSSELEGEQLKCSCNHLTSYGVLVRVTDVVIPAPYSDALTYITYVGCALSIIAHFTSFSIFVYLSNLKTDRKVIHMNLVVALAMAQIIHVCGITLTDHKVTCTIIAALLHYFYTAAFFWMLVEGIYLYTKVVSVFDVESRVKRTVYHLMGWGCPAIIVSISLGSRLEGYGTDKHCWLSLNYGLIWAFVGPVCAVIVANLIIMIIVIRIVVKAIKTAPRRKAETLVGTKAAVKAMCILTPILGVNWALGLLAVNQNLILFEFFFVIINSLQGVFIFLIHCAGNTEVRTAFKQKFDRSHDHSSSSNKNAWLNAGGDATTTKDRSTTYKDRSRPPSAGKNSVGIIENIFINKMGMGGNLQGVRHLAAETTSTSEDQSECSQSGSSLSDPESRRNSKNVDAPHYYGNSRLRSESNVSKLSHTSNGTAETNLSNSSDSSGVSSGFNYRFLQTSSRKSSSVTDSSVALSVSTSLPGSIISEDAE